MVASLLGGVGLFMLGMTLLTDGLRLLAGEALRRLLARFTRSLATGIVTGAIATALIQSSSATTLITIGFVNARLIDFGQALGLIYGANVGTTTTAWLVATIGFKLDVGALALPLIGVGALARLVGRGRLQAAGTGLAGFGLLFVGIDVLKDGMGGLAARFDLAGMGVGFGGRALLVGAGFAMTVVMQSSSAAMAVTLTAVHGGAIGLEQATALVIGQNVGTTLTAGLAAIGGSPAAKRTALAHVGFNLGTGIVALLALAPADAALLALRDRFGWDDTTALSAFHTGFNLFGVALFVPLTPLFAAALGRLVAERGEEFERPLDTQLLRSPAVAVEEARRHAAGAGRVALDGVRAAVAGEDGARLDAVERADHALTEVGRYLGGLATEHESEGVHARHLHLLHAIDHLQRLCHTASEVEHAGPLSADPELAQVAGGLAPALAAASAWLGDPRPGAAPLEAVAAGSSGLAESRKGYRIRLLERAARRQIAPVEGEARLEAVRWLDRVAYHVWRALHHLAGAGHADNGGPASGASGASGATATRAEPEPREPPAPA